MFYSSIKRFLLVATSAIVFIIVSIPLIANAKQIDSTLIQIKLAKLEASSGGRLGVYAINTANNVRVQYRAEELFPFCSTSKIIVVSAILKKSETNPALLQKKITYDKKDIDKSEYAPITQQHIDSGMRIAELCKAAIEYSDNTAMNLLLKILGGPGAVTSYARSIHDNKFRMNRWEPELNSAIPGDTRDTTTPKAMTHSLQQVVLGDGLALSQQKQLQTWLKNNTTGAAKIRAGVPKNWIVGDKTGSGQYGTTNDIGIIWPPGCSPIVIAIYLTQNTKDAVNREDILASATHLVLSELASTDQCIKRKYS
ncbi:MAG: class A beta-lactamase [Gammaproteobacteria bacterium]